MTNLEANVRLKVSSVELNFDKLSSAKQTFKSH